MKIPLYQVDAFTANLFSGNPAAVCMLDHWLDDALLQSIAMENGLSETAFLVPRGSAFELRWFTPRIEIALCGHATLAAAYVLFVRLAWPANRIGFVTRSSGELTVTRQGDLLEMDFPARTIHKEYPSVGLSAALGIKPDAVFSSQEDLMVLLDHEKAVRKVAPDFAALESFAFRGVIVTAPGEDCDFVSRFFAPRVGVPEDPVTGSAHSVLIPYWAEKLGKKTLYARQVSARGGELFCRHDGDRVAIAGRAALYLEGTIVI